VTGRQDEEPVEPTTTRERGPARPLVERLGLGFIAIVAAALFGAMSAAAWVGGELFLAVMAGIGALMTLWAAVATLVRG
jgi:hypothetical protein